MTELPLPTEALHTHQPSERLNVMPMNSSYSNIKPRTGQTERSLFEAYHTHSVSLQEFRGPMLSPRETLEPWPIWNASSPQ